MKYLLNVKKILLHTCVYDCTCQLGFLTHTEWRGKVSELLGLTGKGVWLCPTTACLQTCPLPTESIKIGKQCGKKKNWRRVVAEREKQALLCHDGLPPDVTLTQRCLSYSSHHITSYFHLLRRILFSSVNETESSRGNGEDSKNKNILSMKQTARKQQKM